MKIKVNQEACVGCGLCCSIAEDLFEMNVEGFSQAISSEVPSDKVEEAHQAVESCPTGAIAEE